MTDLVPAVRVRKPIDAEQLHDTYFPAKQEVCGPNGGALPVDIGNATVNLNGDVVAEFDGIEEALGAPADAAAGGDSATSGLIGLVKRLLGKLPSGFQQGAGVVTSTTTRVVLASDGPGVTNLASIAGLQIPPHDNLAITYRTTGNGTGEIDQVIFKTGASTVATLTLAYDASNRLSTVTKS